MRWLLGLVVTLAFFTTASIARTTPAAPGTVRSSADLCHQSRPLARATWLHRGYVATSEESRIMVEAMDGNTAAVRKGLRTLAAQDIPRWRQLAMFNAAFAGRASTVAALLGDGADPNASAVRPAYTATFYRDITRTTQSIVGAKSVAGFKSTGLMQNRPVQTGPAILEAIRCDELPTVKALLKHGANPNIQSAPDALEDPLVEAVLGGDPQMVRLLIEHGADPCIYDSLRAALWNKDQRHGPAPTMASMGKNAGLPLAVLNRLTCGAAPPSVN